LRAASTAARIGALAMALCAAASHAQPLPPAKARQLVVKSEPWFGDFDQMLERRIVRVALPYSRTLFHVDKGHERGIAAELARDFERYINRKHAKRLGGRPLTVYLIASTRGRLVQDVADGLADLAAGNLTVTDRRRELVDFVVPPGGRPVDQIVATGPHAPPVATLEDLAGRVVHVRRATSYHDSLLALNERLARDGRPPVTIAELPDALEDEDELDMLNAGLLDFVVVDDWLARMWAQVLPRIRVRDDLVVRADGATGVAVRKDSPALAAALLDFQRSFLAKQGGVAARQALYHRRVRQLRNNTSGAEWTRFQQTIRLFEKYGARYAFDPLMLAAQGFQESGLRQEARSPLGAIGVMQVMPETGREMNVGDITRLEPNIHAGAKYMDQLMSRYFTDANFSDETRPLFAVAAYNAGPGNIARMRAEAARRGLDPDQWFNHVEVVVAQHLGIQTPTYVRNVYKYYVAYRLALRAQQAAREARGQLEPAPPAAPGR
jgi:membrane-bound lytic murein transglycosylase MltF